jgi:hypothetical protein
MRIVRTFFVVVLAVGTLASPAAAARFTRCCVVLDLPDVSPGPVCVEVRGRRRLAPRRACRLLGGRPIGRGDCSVAACREPAAG